MDGDTFYTEVQSMDIDDGSLTSVPHEVAFVLGVEWYSAFLEMESEKSFEKVVHQANVARLTAMASRLGYFASAVDAGNGWSMMRFLRRS